MISPLEKNAIIDLFPFMGENPVVFDVGSNKGHFSDLVLDEFKDRCSIYLFEPNEKLLSFTEVKYEYKTNITYCDLIVDKYPNKVRKFYFFENFNNELSSIYYGDGEWGSLPVMVKEAATTSIDYYCKSHGISGIDYLKIDVEGADMDVLFGATGMMSDNKIGVIQIEYSHHWGRGGYSFNDLLELCGKFGYSIFKYTDGNFHKVEKLDDSPVSNYFLSQYDLHNHSIGWDNLFIENTSELPKLDLVLEIGSFEGLTSKYICNNLLNKDNPDARLVCVDPLENHYYEGDEEHPYFKDQYYRFKRNTRGLPIELKRGKSEDILPQLNALRFDLVYIDGDHRPEQVYFDASWSFAITKEGGWILFDDYEWRDETKEAINTFLEQCKGHYQLVKKDYQVLIKKTMNYYNSITESYYL